VDVLILEDDRILAQVFCDALEDAGHTVAVANSNAQAFDIIEDSSFDLLIFDLLIDGETCIPVLDFASYALPRAEIILVTGSGLFPRGEMHYSISGVSYRIQKPVKLCDLVFLVEHFERTKAKGAKIDADKGLGQLSA
jgi:DNA-binding NtrC family response regulator